MKKFLVALLSFSAPAMAITTTQQTPTNVPKEIVVTHGVLFKTLNEDRLPICYFDIQKNPKTAPYFADTESSETVLNLPTCNETQIQKIENLASQMDVKSHVAGSMVLGSGVIMCALAGAAGYFLVSNTEIAPNSKYAGSLYLGAGIFSFVYSSIKTGTALSVSGVVGIAVASCAFAGGQIAYMNLNGPYWNLR